MRESFAEMLRVGGKANSLGKANEVVSLVLANKSLLDELYQCVFDEDAWVRMRAIDSIEKICRVHPEWIEPYLDRFPRELFPSTQASIQWHLAQIYQEVTLSESQKKQAIQWLEDLLSSNEIDWIVAANAMDAVAYFVREGSIPVGELIPLLKIQQGHKSKSVVKRANKLLDEYNTYL